MKGVRYVRPDGWEGYCPVCCEWWPIDLEFWTTHSRGGMCRACYRIADSERHRARREAHPELVEREAARLREYRSSPGGKAANKAASAAWRQANRDRKKAIDRAYYERNHDRIRAYHNAYRQRQRAARELLRDTAA